MRLPGIVASLGLASKREKEEERLMMEAQSELVRVILDGLPTGRDSHVPNFRDALEDSAKQLPAETCHKARDFIEENICLHEGIASLVVDVLGRRDSDAALNRLMDNFSYMEDLGWRFAGALAGMVLRSFPSTVIHRDLTVEQQHALIRLEDAQWDKSFLPVGGKKHRILRLACNDVASVVVQRPEDIDRIIELARDRNPKAVDDYLSLLDTGSVKSLSSGAL